jgi:hypothetical protein
MNKVVPYNNSGLIMSQNQSPTSEYRIYKSIFDKGFIPASNTYPFTYLQKNNAWDKIGDDLDWCKTRREAIQRLKTYDPKAKIRR